MRPEKRDVLSIPEQSMVRRVHTEYGNSRKRPCYNRLFVGRFQSSSSKVIGNDSQSEDSH